MELSASNRLEPQPKPATKRASLTITIDNTNTNTNTNTIPKRASRASLEPPIPFSPSRISSEAPEVVPGQPLPQPFVYMNYGEARSKRASSEESEEADLKPWEVREKEMRKLVPTPQVVYDQLSESEVQISYQEKPTPRRRTFGLLPFVLCILVAFLIGGGIGGGVGGAIAATERSKLSILQANFTTTTSAGPAASTVIVDTAGCPLVNNSTYTSPSGTTFIKLCATEIESSSGQYIEISNSVQGSFDACLDSCASTTGCVGASWVIFSPTNPSRNSVCYLKNKTGVATAASAVGETVVSGFLASAVGM